MSRTAPSARRLLPQLSRFALCVLTVAALFLQGCASTPLEPSGRGYHRLSRRLEQIEHPPAASHPSVICECELVTRPALESALQSLEAPDLDDLRRDLRLGMGPCQAAFCGYRAAALATRTLPAAPDDGGLADFQQERWRGLRPLAWGQTLRQLEFSRRIYAELLGLPSSKEPK